MAAGTSRAGDGSVQQTEERALKRRHAGAPCAEDERTQEDHRVGLAVDRESQFIGSMEYEQIQHPGKEGQIRYVCLTQVESNKEVIDPKALAASDEEVDKEVIDPKALAALEYRVEPDRESVLRRLRTEWDAALAHQEAQRGEPDVATPTSVRARLLEREHPAQEVQGTYKVYLEETEWDLARETDIFYVLLEGAVDGACAYAQGDRQAMEDRYCLQDFVIETNTGNFSVHLTAVFDGHGGFICAQSMSKYFQIYLKSRLEWFNSEEMTIEGIWNALKLAPVDFSRRFDQDGSGCCVNATLEIEGVGLFCLNVGDSRAFLMTGDGEAIQLSEDQTLPSTKYERGNQNRNIKISRGRATITQRGHTHLLSAARAIGDKGTKNGENYTIQYVSTRPKIVMPTKALIEERLGRSLREEEPLLLVQGCDGIFDVGTTNQYALFIAEMLKKGATPAQAMATAVEAAYRGAFVESNPYKRGSTDNLTMTGKWVHIT